MMRLPLFLASFLLVMFRSAAIPRAPKQLTWEVSNPTGLVVWKLGPVEKTPGTWWPTLTPDVCQLALGLDTWDIPYGEDPLKIPLTGAGTTEPVGYRYGCGDKRRRCMLHQEDFYVCPKDGRTRAHIGTCGGPESLYCKAWGCETTGTTYWKPASPWDWITVARPPRGRPVTAGEGVNRVIIHPCSDTALKSGSPYGCHNSSLCNPLQINFTNPGKKLETLPQWLKGRIWGLRFYVDGYDFGLWFKIQLRQRDTP